MQQEIPTTLQLDAQALKTRKANAAFLNSLELHKYNAENLSKLRNNCLSMRSSNLKQMLQTSLRVIDSNLREKYISRVNLEEERDQLQRRRCGNEKRKNKRQKRKLSFNKKLEQMKIIIEIVRYLVLLLGTCLAAIAVFIIILQIPQVALPQGGRIVQIQLSYAFKVVGTTALSLMGFIIVVLGLFILFSRPIK